MIEIKVKPPRIKLSEQIYNILEDCFEKDKIYIGETALGFEQYELYNQYILTSFNDRILAGYQFVHVVKHTKETHIKKSDVLEYDLCGRESYQKSSKLEPLSYEDIREVFQYIRKADRIKGDIQYEEVRTKRSF